MSTVKYSENQAKIFEQKLAWFWWAGRRIFRKCYPWHCCVFCGWRKCVDLYQYRANLSTVFTCHKISNTEQNIGVFVHPLMLFGPGRGEKISSRLLRRCNMFRKVSLFNKGSDQDLPERQSSIGATGGLPVQHKI